MGDPVVWDADKVVTALRNTVGDPSGATNVRWTDDEMDLYYNRGALQVVLDAEGEPTHYYLWRKLGDDPLSSAAKGQPGSIFLHPVPAAAGTDKLRIYGYKYPDAIANTAGTAIVELHAVHVEAALLYAASLIMADDGEPAQSAFFLARYEDQVKKVLGSLARKDRSGTSRLMPKGSRQIYPARTVIGW
jgi:hypothetical protein